MCPICLFELSIEVIDKDKSIRICAYCGYKLEEENGNRLGLRRITTYHRRDDLV